MSTGSSGLRSCATTMIVTSRSAVQVAEQPDDLLLVAQVEVGQRLVEQQQVGVVDDRLRDGHPLLLAAGDLRHPPVGELGRADPVQRRVDPRPLLGGGAPQAEPPAGEAEGDQVAAADGVAERGGVVLRDVADPPVAAPGRGAEHLDPPGGDRAAGRARPGTAWSCRRRSGR